MNRIMVILTIDTENLPANFPEIIQHEREVVAKWKKEGFLVSFFYVKHAMVRCLFSKTLTKQK